MNPEGTVQPHEGLILPDRHDMDAQPISPEAAGSAPPHQEEHELAELDKLTRAAKALLDAVEASKIQTRRAERYEQVLQSLDSAAKAIAVAASTPGPVATGGSAIEERDCIDCDEGSPCGCISTGCCCFEIVLDKVRAIQPQLEPADSGDIVLPPTINALECQIFASVNNVGILVPSLSTTMDLRVGSVLFGGKPGLWSSIDRVINRVCIKKGSTLTVEVMFEGAERDEGIERLIGWKDEFGYASGFITLDCCMPKIYPAMPTDLTFDHGGTGGGVPGMISLAFYARRVCC